MYERIGRHDFDLSLGGEICEESEAILIAKTTEARVVALTERVKVLHSYDCPCVVTVPIAGGNAVFLDWISAQTA